MSACGGELRTRVETTCGGGIRYVADAEAAQLVADGLFVEVGREGAVRVLRDVVPPELEERAAAARTHGHTSDVADGFALMKERKIRRFGCACGVSWYQPDDGKTPVECPSCGDPRDVVRGVPLHAHAGAA